jgi:hypothetical protein
MPLFGKIKSKHIEILPGGTFNYNPYGGRDYFVNNITGSAYADGSSWANAMDQVSTAITAQIAYSLALTGVAPTAAGFYGRDRIFVMGTGTAYTAISTLPSMCDIIGVGAEPRGNGTGIVIIGVNGADGIAGTARGLGLYNMQFRAGGSFWCADFVSLFRSVIDHCVFHSNVAATDGGLRFSGASGGLWIKNCHWTGDTDYINKIGIQISGTHFNESVIEDCVIGGTDKGIAVAATVINGDQTVIRNNHIGDTGKGCTAAVNDDQPSNAVGWINYCTNTIMGTGLLLMDNNGAARCHGNMSANGFIAATAD